METMEMIILVGSVILAASLGAGIGGRRVIARARYNAWRGSIRAVPIAFRAARTAIIDLLLYGGITVIVVAAWVILIGVLI
jgi:hypothetical protein